MNQRITLTGVLFLLGDITEMVVVLVDGNWYPAPDPTSIWDVPIMNSWYLNSRAFGNFEKMISKDFVNHLEANYRLKPLRAITGHSAGGFGALWVGLRNMDVFQGIASFSGVPNITRIVDFMFFEDPKFAVNLDFAGIQTLADADNATALPPGTVQSPSLGYMSDALFKIYHAFSASSTFDFGSWNHAFSLDAVELLVVGNPDPHTIANVSYNSTVVQKWKSYHIIDVIDSMGAAELNNKLKLFYFDCGLRVDFMLTDQNEALHNHLNAIGVNHFYETFSSGVCVSDCAFDASTSLCTNGSYPCGRHFADADGLQHGAGRSRFYLGELPYTGSIGSRFTKCITMISEKFTQQSPSSQPIGAPQVSTAIILSIRSIFLYISLLLTCVFKF